MDFTREPIIETIITPKEGYKLVVRSSKGTAQEEYFVDAVEVVSFGHALFFRSMERPKSFLVPVADYEILEVREARMVLKNAGLDRSIKIGGGREGTLKASNREADKGEVIVAEEEETVVEQEEAHHQPAEAATEAKSDARLDKKRDRRRHYRKRRGSRGEEREEAPKEEGTPEVVTPTIPPLEDEKINIPPPEEGAEAQAAPMSSSLLSSLLQPPPTLISETINRYRENALFKNAFFLTEEEQYKPHDKVHELLNEDDEEDFAPPLQEPTFAKEGETGEVSTEQPLEPIEHVQYEPMTEVIQEETHESEEQVEQVEEEFAPTMEEPVFHIEEIQHVDHQVEEEKTIEEKDVKESKVEQMSLPLFAEEESTVKESNFIEEETFKEEESTLEEPVRVEEEREEHPSH